MKLKIDNVEIATSDVRNITVTKTVANKHLAKKSTGKDRPEFTSKTGYYGDLASALKSAASELPYDVEGKLTFEKLLALQEGFCESLYNELKRLGLPNSRELLELAQKNGEKAAATQVEAPVVPNTIDWG